MCQWQGGIIKWWSVIFSSYRISWHACRYHSPQHIGTVLLSQWWRVLQTLLFYCCLYMYCTVSRLWLSTFLHSRSRVRVWLCLWPQLVHFSKETYDDQILDCQSDFGKKKTPWLPLFTFSENMWRKLFHKGICYTERTGWNINVWNLFGEMWNVRA